MANDPPKKLFIGKNDLRVISMDTFARDGYKRAKCSKGKPINSVDAFLVDVNNQWYLIEFKDRKINSKNQRDNIEKKGMGSFLMLLDILSSVDSVYLKEYNMENLMDFAKQNITYIVVCSFDDNPNVYNQIKGCDLVGEKYTPDFLQKFRDYFFKDAYIYTEDYFEKRFVKYFIY